MTVPKQMRPLWTCPKCGVKLLTSVRFAGITNLTEKGMTCAFALPAPKKSARFVKVEEVVPGWWVHHLRIADVDELDDQVQAWLRESYRLMGMQERLASARAPRRSSGRTSP